MMHQTLPALKASAFLSLLLGVMLFPCSACNTPHLSSPKSPPPHPSTRLASSTSPPLPRRLMERVDGVFTQGQFLDLGPQDRIFARYSPIADSGVELERVTRDVVVWRTFCKGLGVDHSQYRHEVFLRVKDDVLTVISQGSSGDFREMHTLSDGDLIKRME